MKSLKEYIIKEARENISSFLEYFWLDDNWYDEIYGALANDNLDEDEYAEKTRLNLIDNGYCLTVCLCVSMNFEDTKEGKEIEYYLLDDGGHSYHFFMKKGKYYYDAYNCSGVDKLSDLEFVHKYMKGKTEKYLQDNLIFVSKGEYDYEYAQSLIK